MIRTLMKSIRQYKRASILAPIFMVLEVFVETMIPFIMANLIDDGIAKGDMNVVVKLGIVLIVAALISMTFGATSGALSIRAGAGLARNLRHDQFYAVQKFAFSNIDKFSTASLVTRMTTDVTNIQMAYQMIIRLGIRCIAMLAFSLIMVFSLNHEMSLIFICVLPVLGIGLFAAVMHVHPIFMRVFRIYDKLNTVVQENIRGIRVVKSYVREEEEKSKFVTVSADIFKNFTKAEKRISFNSPLMQLCMYTCMVLISWIGAKLVVESKMTTGDLMSVFSYAQMALIGLMMLSMVFVMIIIARASAERIVEVLHEVPDIQNPDDPVPHVPNGDISFEHVSFSYVNDPDKLCLFDVDLRIKAGETIGIIGGTGTSKTTLIQLISRLYDVTKGRVMVGDHDVREYDLETLRDAVAVVLQKNVLFSGTIEENLRWGNEHATDEELEHVCKLAQADEFIKGFPKGYDTYIEQDGSNVSGGQKQRLCIARALLKKPKVLIMDDSTSAVDTKTDALIRQAMRTEIPGTTKLIIAQRIASVQDADKIMVMDNGRVVAFGTHEELLASNTIYQEVYNSQMGGGDFDE